MFPGARCGAGRPCPHGAMAAQRWHRCPQEGRTQQHSHGCSTEREQGIKQFSRKSSRSWMKAGQLFTFIKKKLKYNKGDTFLITHFLWKCNVAHFPQTRPRRVHSSGKHHKPEYYFQGTCKQRKLLAMSSQGWRQISYLKIPSEKY